MSPQRNRFADDAPAIDGRVRLDGLASQALHTGCHRLMFGAVLFALAFFIVGLRLVDVVLLNDGFEPRLARAAPTQHAQLGRRDIVDRNGVLLATNLPTASLFADPARVLDAGEAAGRLVRVLPEMSRAEILDKLTSPRRFVWLKRNLTPRQQDAINRLGLPGIAFQREERRVYPLGALFSHVVGFADIDGRGIAGVEKSFDETLRAAAEGEAAPLRLSLDTRVQHALREELARGMATFDAAGAAGVVLDATNGAVLAMVSLPDFDPNRSRDGRQAARFNRATLGAYEMGSTFKVFTTAMALDAGVVTLRDGYDASQPIHVARFVIHDYKPANRWLSVPEIFVRSSNIGAAKMALDIGTRRQREYLSHLGLLSPAEIELPEVTAPILPSPWREINTMTIAYGHGLAVSPLQLTSAVAAVVNGGVFYPPTLVRRSSAEPSLGWRVIEPDTSTRMRALMHLVVARGTGKKAAVPGYLVGGKTGTAEKPGRGGYRRKSLISSFVAAFPIDAPRFVVFAMLDEPRGTKKTHNYATGGWTAAPIVGRVIARLGPMEGLAARGDDAEDPAEARLVKIAGREGAGVAF
ncbi:MAG: peptidoglycan D,D-transpeptidase FtsI family protein [Alphaproteobacteria bacterium]